MDKVRRAVIAGVKAGRKRYVTSNMGGRIATGLVVGATDKAISIEVRGMVMDFAWTRLTRRQLDELARKYAAE